jgi:arsenical pump membrane protein
LSNDAAVLVMTPTVLLLLRAVYPKRHPVFVAPFAIAVFVSAGVAPLVISNPMNLIFAEHTGIDFNDYAIVMIPIALAGWLASYVVLAWLFRGELADTTPAYGGAWPDQPPPLDRYSVIVCVGVLAALCAYPVMALVGQPLWPVAAAGGAVCAIACLAAGHDVRSLGRGIAWSIFPFLLGVFVLAIALERVGMVDWLRSLYGGAHPLPAIGVTSTIGSAVLNNHPMSVLNAFALDGTPDPGHTRAFAALVGGNLGPRILPVGSLAALLWFDMLRRHNVVVRASTFVRVGLALTVPTLIVSLTVLWAIGALR